MSRPLSFTSMIRPEMMLSAATRMIIVSTRNITLRSTASALKKVGLRSFQVVTAMPCARRVHDGQEHVLHLVGVLDHHLDLVHALLGDEIILRLGERHVDDVLVVVRHADLEDRHDRIVADARRGAEDRLGPFRRDDGDARAEPQLVPPGHALADGDAARGIETFEGGCLVGNALLLQRGAEISLLRLGSFWMSASGCRAPARRVVAEPGGHGLALDQAPRRA